tara:strand:+ start:15613 stop:16203 length:591 start_codon:yes stop_codon:yes gene_type:complete
MSLNILFISETTLKDRSLLQDNVDPKLIKPTIKQAQDMYIEPILGTGLYQELQQQIEDDDLSELNITLLNLYITDCMCWYVASEMVMSLGFKLTNKNVLRKTSENSNDASLSELFDLMEYYKNKAEWYAQRITNYLCENIVDYPLYNNPGSGVDTIHPNNSSYSTGMFLGNDDIRFRSFSDMYQSQFGAIGKDYRD